MVGGIGIVAGLSHRELSFWDGSSVPWAGPRRSQLLVIVPTAPCLAGLAYRPEAGDHGQAIGLRKPGLSELLSAHCGWSDSHLTNAGRAAQATGH